MDCKNCGKELPEGSQLCPFCEEVTAQLPEEPETEQILNQQLVEEAVEEAAEEIAEEVAEDNAAEGTEDNAEDGEAENAEGEESAELEDVPEAKKKSKLWIIILAAVAGVALLAVLVGAILFGLGLNPFTKNELAAKENYTVEEALARQKADAVVATIGDEMLTNGELQIYYWEAVTGFINENYYYLSSFGLDITKPLNEQSCPMAEGQTWQQFFLEMALTSWQRFATLQRLAQENGYEMEAEMKTFLEDLPQSMQTNATNYGYDSVIAWLEDSCGPGVSEEGYIEYVSAYYEGTFFLTSKYDEMNPTLEEAEAYFNENEQTFANMGVTKEDKYYNVRHILIEIEGGTQNEDGTVTYSEEEWEACRQKAQDLLEQWEADDGTEEGFAMFAAEHSADGGSSTNGGLYEKLTEETNFVQEFKDWYLESSRKPGDTGLVKSSYGYHIMYFSGSSDVWVEAATEELLTERVSAYIEEGIAKYPMKVNYRKIVLGDHKIA